MRAVCKNDRREPHLAVIMRNGLAEKLTLEEKKNTAMAQLDVEDRSLD